jgi:hypothetical protein
MENKKIIDYIVIEESRKEVLQKFVLQKLNEGYSLLGGVSYGGHYERFAQAMIKHED